MSIVSNRNGWNVEIFAIKEFHVLFKDTILNSAIIKVNVTGILLMFARSLEQL